MGEGCRAVQGANRLSRHAHSLQHARAAAPDLTRLLTPRAIAVVGASEDRKRIGGQPIHALTEFGYRGAVYPVNPKHAQIQGLTCYPDVGAVPQPCDVALLALPAQEVPEVIEQCGRAGIAFAVVLSAGFGEVGNRELQARLEAAIKSSGVRVVGPNCVGVLNLRDHVYSGFGAGFRNPGLKRGPVAMVSQSGGFGYSVVAFAEHEGIGFNYMVSSGNEADLTSLDIIEHLLQCPEIELIVCYMEGIRDGRRLRRLGARALELSKPIVVWKVGNTGRGARAAMSHTANLTSNYELYRTAFREGGFIEIGDVYDLVDVALAFRGRRLPAGNGVGVLTTSGGAGVLLADLCEQQGLELPALAAATDIELRKLAPGFAALENPVDLSAQLAQNADGFNQATRILLEDPHIDLAIVRSFPGVAAEEWAHGLSKIAGAAGKPVLVSLSGLAHKSAATIAVLESANIPCFPTPGRAVIAAAALAGFSAKRKRHQRQAPERAVERQTLDLPAAAQTLGERKSKACLAAYGIPVVNEVAIAVDAIDALSSLAISFPVVVKVDSPDVPHKTEAGAVRLGVANLNEVKVKAREVIAATRRFNPDARIDGVLIQEMAQGVELIAGGVNDPVFGPYVVLGTGGIFSELFKDTTLRFAPFDVATAREMIGEIKGARLLHGYRGDTPHDIEALAQAIARLSWLVFDHADRIAELDINPLFVRRAGSGVVAADGLIVCRT